MEKRAPGRPRGGGSKLNRTETVTIRLDPKLRYLTELAARKQRRTVSSFIEWAIEQALSQVVLDDQTRQTVLNAAGQLWDPDEADRLVSLGCGYPDLLTYDEQVLWKLIREWLRVRTGSQAEVTQYMPQLRKHWDAFKKVAAGEADARILPLQVAGPSVRDVATAGLDVACARL